MRIVLIGSLLIGVGCNGPSEPPAAQPAPAKEQTMNEAASGTVEEMLAKVEALPEGTRTFELFVPQNLTWQGRPIAQNMAMAVVTDKLLGKNLFPNGFDQRPTGRRYRYRLDAPRELLPRQDAGSSEGLARQLSWTMDNVLQWRAKHPRAGTHVFRNAEEMLNVWGAHGGELGGSPKVDFGRYMVVAVFEGEGAYKETRSILRVTHGGGKLWIILEKFSRPWAMINPASVIAIPRADGEPIFVDAESAEAKALSGATGD
jgi:hypothetical protein